MSNASTTPCIRCNDNHAFLVNTGYPLVRKGSKDVYLLKQQKTQFQCQTNVLLNRNDGII